MPPQRAERGFGCLALTAPIVPLIVPGVSLAR
jgi:hypothetical protein